MWTDRVILAVLLLACTGGLVEDPTLQRLAPLVQTHPEEAIARLEALVQENPSKEAYWLLAQAWARVDAYQSLPWLERLFERDGEHEEGWKLWADILVKSGQPEYALLRLDQQLRRYPESSFLTLLKAQLSASQGSRKEAEQAFWRVTQLAPAASPHQRRALYSLAHLYLSDRLEEKERWEGLDSWVDEVLASGPADEELGVLLAQCSLKQDRPSRAFALLSDLLRRDPENAQAHFYAGRALRSRGDWRRGAEHYRRFRELEEKSRLQALRKRWGSDPTGTSVVELLRAIAERTDPELNIFLNQERAELYRSRLGWEEDPGRRLTLQADLAREWLRAGRSEEAIEQALALRAVLNSAQRPDPDLARSVGEILAMAYLQLGERQNCVAQHSPDACLMPITGGGVHRLQQGARQAYREFASLLESDPDSLGYRWLLNLVSMTLGEYPQGVPGPWRIPPEVFNSEYPMKRFFDVAPRLGVDVLGLAGGSILEDFDGDGHLDLMASSWGLRDPLRYFHNNGDGSFSDWTSRGGLSGEWGGLNLLQADYNNDGYPDVLVLRGGWFGFLGPHEGDHPNSLLRNNGDGTFTNVTVEAGLLSFHPTQTAAWADYDLDGHLDLFIGNESTEEEIRACELYHNDGDGTFTEVALEVGLDAWGVIKGVAWGDYDNDGDPDLYLSRFDQGNLLYRNEGSVEGNWQFVEVGEELGVREPRLSFPVWFWDYDNDGHLDLLVAAFSSYFQAALEPIVADYLGLEKAGVSRLYRNRGDGTFSDVTHPSKIDAVLMAMGANYGDLDNDGFLDCYFGTGQPRLSTLIPNRMFRNSKGKFFQDVTTAGGFGHLQKGHGIAFGDIDHDGDQDIYAVLGGAFQGDTYPNALFENPGSSNHWITLRLQGVRSNRFAVGARVKVEVETEEGLRTIHRVVSTGGSFGASSLQQEIGLGQAQAVASIEIRWPVRNAPLQVLKGVPLDSIVTIREGEADFVVVQPPPHGSQAVAGKSVSGKGTHR